MPDLSSMPRNEQISYWIGRLCLALGRGTFRDEVTALVDYYQLEAYTRGVEVGKKTCKS